MKVALLAGAMLARSSCFPERVECSPATLAAFESAYVVEVVARCPDVDRCPELADIERRYAIKRKEWVNCR